MSVARWASAVVATVLLCPAPVMSGQDRRPNVSISTPDGSLLIGPTAATGAMVSGRATDDRGVEYVLVDLCSKAPSREGVRCGGLLSEGYTSSAELKCRERRRRCTWTVALPPTSGEYVVVATVTDRSSKTARSKEVDVFVASVGTTPM